MSLRLREIARMAGVSEATVSRVLNERPGVAAETRVAVRKIVDELGYRRSRSRIGTVGLIMPELDNPVFPAFAQAISTQLAREGFATILCTLAAEVDEDDYVSMLLERGVAGIVFVCGMHANSEADRSKYQALLERGVPVVFVNGTMEGLAAPFIAVDDALAAELAVQHLVSLGHRRIGCAVGPRRLTPARRKIEGYVRAMEKAFGEAPEQLLLEGIFWFEGGRFALETLLKHDVTALVCGSDMIAFGAIAAARHRGLDVPRDISVVGFDDIVLASFTDPPLTTVAQPVAAMGNATARVLVEHIRTGFSHTGEFIFQPDLVVRGSTAPLAARAGRDGVANG